MPDYEICHNIYVPTKTKGVIMVQEAKGFKKVGVVHLYFYDLQEILNGQSFN